MKNSMRSSNQQKVYSYPEIISINPCNNCPAPCCRMTIRPDTMPTTHRAIDHLLYLLRFADHEAIWSSDGTWTLVHWSVCTALESDSCCCKLHGSMAKPLICREYDAVSCWYKRTFIGDGDPDVLRINLARMEVLVDEVGFDDVGRIVRMPEFGEARAAVEHIALLHVFEMSPSLMKDDV